MRRAFWDRRQPLTFLLCALLVTIPANAKKKQPSPFRWSAGTPGCEFGKSDDSHYRWRMIRDDLDISLLVDPQELAKSRMRPHRPLGVFLSVTYTGHGKFDFPADLRMQFLSHHNVTEGYWDPTEFSTQIQNDMDTHVFDMERDIKKHPEKTEAETDRAREYQKTVAEFIEFLSTQSLE